MVVISLNIVHVESTTKVVKYPLDWEFYLKYNPDLIQAGINTKDRAIEHYRNFGEKEKRWHHPDDQPSFDACDRAKDILNNNDFLNETTNSYRIYCKQLLKLKIYDSNKWKGIGNVASWKYSILYDMYMNEIKPLKTISSSNKLINNNHHHSSTQQQQQQQQQHDSKVCFIVKPSIYAFETIRQKKARLSQNLYTLDINQFITSLLKQTNILWEAYFILTTKQIKYHDQLLQIFNNIGNNDYRLFTHIITSDHHKNSNIGSSSSSRNSSASSSSSASSNINTAGGFSGNSAMMNHDESSTNNNFNNDNINNNNWIFIDHAIEDIIKQEQCRWITITTANNVYGSEIVDKLLKVYTSSQQINHDHYQNASTTSTTTDASEQFDNDYNNNNNDNDHNNGKILADLSILPLDSKYYLALNSIKLNETNNANDRCHGIDSMMDIYYRAYTSQPIIIPGRIFLDSIFFSRQKLNKHFIPFNLFLKNISLSLLSSYNSNDNNNQNYHDTFSSSSSSSQPCYFHCHEGEYIQYLIRNQNWKYLRYPLGGLSTTIFHGPFSPTYCIASKNVWLDNIDLDNIACYPHDTIANIYELKDNPLVVEKSIMDWKHYDQSERICLRLSEVGNKVAIIQSKSKHLYFHKNNKTRLNHNYKNKLLLTSISANHKDNRHNNNNINYLNHNENYIFNNIINNNMNDENLNNLLRKLIIYKENLMKFVKHYDANLSNLIIYDIQSITSSSMKSKEVIMNNIQIFSSSIIENNYNLDVSATSPGSDSQQPYLFYIIIVDSTDLNLISHYIPSYYDNVYLLVTTTASSSSSSRSSSSPWVIMSNTHDHSIEKQLYVLNHIFNNNNNKNKQITLNDFFVLYFLSTNSRGPLSLRKNNKWMNKFSYIFEKFPQISMISTTAAIPRQELMNNISTSFDYYNNNDYSTYLHLLISLLSPYSSLPINIDTFAMKSSKILLTILQRYVSIYSYYLSTLHNDGSSSSIYSTITSEHYDKHNINHENHFKSNTSSNLSSKQYYLLLKSMLIETIYSSNSKISSLLHYTRTNNLYYEYDPVVKQTSQLLSSSSLQRYNDEYILSYRIPSMWNLSSWCRIYPNEIIFLRYGGEHLGLNAELDGYECSNSISTTGDNFMMMSKSMLDFHHQYPFVNLILPESPIGGILYNLYYDNSQQLWNTLNLQQRVQQYVNISNNWSSRSGSTSSSYSSIDDSVSKDNNNQIPSKVCIIVRTTANHDRKRNRENEKFPYYEMDLQGLIKSLYWQSNLNWEAYFLVTDHSKFEIRLNEILNEYKLLFNDMNRLHFVEIPSEYLPSYTSKDAGYTATDYVLKKILKFPQCKWISFTNGDNAYGANIIDNTLKARLSIGSASLSSNDDRLIPQMILQPFSSRNLIQKIYSERKINDNDYKKKCIYLEAMMDHTLLAVAAQPYPGVGSVDLASIFIHSKDFIKENIYFSTFSNTGCSGCQDGLLASKLKERGWKYMRLPLDGLKSIIYHGPSELLCIAEGNVWVDFPHNNQVGCITHEIAAKFREEDMMSSSRSSSSDEDSKRWKFDWNHFDHSERICLRITAYGKDHIHL